MSTLILGWTLLLTHVMLAFAMMCAAIYLIRGPRAQDRVLGLDTLYVNSMLLMLTLGIRYGSDFFFDAALIIALVGFVATAALAKFLMRGEVIE